jgi:predicted Zn finger-like uncharacterized protein
MLITCPSCEASLKLPDNVATTGKRVKCPNCQTALAVDRPKTQPKEPAPSVEQGQKKKVVAKSKASPAEQNGDAEAPRPKTRKAPSASALLGHMTWLLKKEERILFPNLFPFRLDLLQTDGKSLLGYVKETTSRLFKMFVGGTRIGRFFPIYLGVFENDGEPAPFVIRIPGLKFNPMGLLLGMKERKVEVVTHEGELICSFVMQLFSLTPSFHVRGPDDQKIADLKFKTLDMKKGLPPRMILQSLDGQEWGIVTGEEEAKIAEQLKAGKKFIATGTFFKKLGLLVKVDPNAADRVINKQMLIAAAVAMRIFDVHKIFGHT